MTPLTTLANFAELRALLETPKKILITTHFKPDADAIGSSLGLLRFLRGMGHEAIVAVPSDYPSFLFFLENEGEIIDFESKKEACIQKTQEAEIIFCLDFSRLDRLEKFEEHIRDSSAIKVLIDHHEGKDNFAKFELWSTHASSTSELIYDFIHFFENPPFDLSMAEPIYAGMITDTGSFKFPSTSARVHRIAAEMIDMGLKHFDVHHNIYDSYSKDRLKFLGFALNEKLFVHEEYNTAFFMIEKDDLKRFNSQTGDTEGLVNYALSIQGIRFAALFTEREGIVKISFRSVGDFSAAKFSEKHFQGGGHKNAAGGRSFESIAETVGRFKDLLPLYREQLVAVDVE